MGNLCLGKGSFCPSPAHSHDLLIHAINMKKKRPSSQVCKMRTSNKRTLCTGPCVSLFQQGTTVVLAPYMPPHQEGELGFSPMPYIYSKVLSPH